MDATAERLSRWFGSTPFIVVHLVWFIAWFPLGGSTDLLTLIVSLEAIFLSLFILRAETVQGERMEASIKQAEKDTKRDIAKSDTIIKKLNRGNNGRRS